jgi:hypothetical protein
MNMAKQFAEGQAVRFDGRTNVINDRVYAGLVGTVHFQCREEMGVPGLVYVNFRLPKQRRDRCISVHHESLTAVA